MKRQEQEKPNQSPTLDKSVGERIKQGREWIKNHKTLTVLITIPTIIGIIVISTIYKWDWIGIGEDSNRSTTIEKETDTKTGIVIKTIEKETENFQSFKTLWDWLQLSGILAIPIALYYFERTEQKRADKRNDLEVKESASIAREEALEAYIYQVSQLLIDKGLAVEIQNIAKNIPDQNSECAKVIAIKEELESDSKISIMLDIIRALSLSILRKLGKDGERKGEVIRFLIDIKILDKLNLASAELAGANLAHANLTYANFQKANFQNANLVFADLYFASLQSTNLTGANLEYTNFQNADLSYADFKNANFQNADLGYATFGGVDFTGANLEKANLAGADFTSLLGIDSPINLTPAQVKKAVNWQDAKFTEYFYKQLVSE
jgi:uncharacterized protein YjbI with pentapeptide repeats